MSLAAWLTVCGSGALVLGAVALAVDRTGRGRLASVAGGLWWASLVRLALPPSVGSPIGVRAPEGGRLHRGMELGESWTAFGAGAWVVVWALGAALVAALTIGGLVREARAWHLLPRRAPKRSTRRAVERMAGVAGLRRAPRVSVTGGGAACVGLFDPWISIPRELEGSSRRQDLEVVLLHEFAHLQRRDAWRRLALLVFCCAFWFHPTVWFASRSLLALAELDCDRRAASVARGGPATCRRALLEAVRPWLAPAQRTLAPGFRPARSLVLRRIRALDRAEFGRASGLRPGSRSWLRRVTGPLACSASLAVIGPLLPSPRMPLPSEVDGCLRQRYAVFAAMAEIDSLPPSTTTNP